MAKWNRPLKATNQSLPLIAGNKKLTAEEFNELTNIINENFDSIVAPNDQPYARQGENWVAANTISYTDQQAREAQALQQATGTNISFDRPKSYGYPSALTGTITFTFDFTNAINGTAQVVRVNSPTKPTLPASAKLLVDGWAANVDVYYYMTVITIDATTPTYEVHVTASVAL